MSVVTVQETVEVEVTVCSCINDCMYSCHHCANLQDTMTSDSQQSDSDEDDDNVSITSSIIVR